MWQQQNYLVSWFVFSFFTFFLLTKQKKIWFWLAHQKINRKHSCVVVTANNISNNQAPVPSVCVRVPHSPSLDSGENSDSSSPVEKVHHDFATLVVREFVKPKTTKDKKWQNKIFPSLTLLKVFCLVLHLHAINFHQKFRTAFVKRSTSSLLLFNESLKLDCFLNQYLHFYSVGLDCLISSLAAFPTTRISTASVPPQTQLN